VPARVQVAGRVPSRLGGDALLSELTARTRRRRRTNRGSRSENPGLLAILCQNPAMAELDELKIPRAMRPVAEDIIEITDGVCAEPVED
jgi:hypothetical protein